MNEDEALVEKQRKLSEQARKSVSMTPIGEIMRKRLNLDPPKPVKFAPLPSRIPPWQGISQRRFIIVKSQRRANVIWIDDDNSCQKDYGPDFNRQHTLDDEGFIERKDWHSYTMISEFKKTNPYAIRCPASLSFEERQRIEIDDPEGHFESRLRAAIADTDRRSGAKIEDEESFA